MATLSERVEDVTGEKPTWWAIELYKVVFLLFGGLYIGWLIGVQSNSAPPGWLAWGLFPGIFYLLWTVLPWPGKGAGGLSM